MYNDHFLLGYNKNVKYTFSQLISWLKLMSFFINQVHIRMANVTDGGNREYPRKNHQPMVSH